MAMTAPRVVRTMCPMNCHPTFCGMLVEVDDGKLKTVSGDKENPDSSLEMSVILFLHVFSTCKFSTDIWGRRGNAAMRFSILIASVRALVR